MPPDAGYHRLTMPIEYEIKVRGEREALLAALEAVGARPAGPRLLEDDLVLDTVERRILRAGGLLRLRRRGDRFLLTLKGLSPEHGEVKAMTEIETEVADGIALCRLLDALGFAPATRYQKYRTAFSCPVPGCASVALTLDETPVGDFLEIEGDPESIHRCAAALGFGRDDYETRSYLEIHRADGEDGEMVFPGEADAPWDASAGSPADEA